MKAVKITVTILVILLFAIIINHKQHEIKKWIDDLLGVIEDDVQRNIEKYAEEQAARSNDDPDDSKSQKKLRKYHSSRLYGQSDDTDFPDGLNEDGDIQDPGELPDGGF